MGNFQGYPSLLRQIKHLNWTHNIILLQRIKDLKARYWYMVQCITGHWSKDYLAEAIKLDYYGKHGALANNFDTTLPATEALEVKSLLKDPYIFDMLTFTDQYDERDIEIGLIKHIEKFLVEMGAGFAFMGRQYHIEVSGDDYYIDMLMYDSDVEITTIDGKSIVCIHVPQADWRMKPVFLNENPYKGSFKRNHEGDYHCTEMEVRAMIRDANEDGNDGGLLDAFTLDDIDTNTLHGYRNQFRILNADHDWNDKDDKEFLRLLGGYTKNRQTGKEGLTVAGLMMFGTGLAIRERFGNFRMDYLDMSHLEGEERYRDRLTYDGRWENNLYQFFRIVMPKLTFDLPHPFHLEGYQRVDDTPQMKAVREGFTNSIIHSDLFLDSGILRIEKHDDCLCLRNPGNLKLPIGNIYEGGVSKARNPRIQNMLRMIGYGENIGSGFPKIISAWQKAGWGKPELIDKYELQEVELRLPIPNETGGQTSGQTSGQTGSPKTIEKVFELIKDNPYITRQELVDKIGIKASAIQKHIEKLKAQKRIERVGSSTFGGHWDIKEKIILCFIIETTIFSRRLSFLGAAYFSFSSSFSSIFP